MLLIGIHQGVLQHYPIQNGGTPILLRLAMVAFFSMFSPTLTGSGRDTHGNKVGVHEMFMFARKMTHLDLHKC